jgi:hypothetical protein
MPLGSLEDLPENGFLHRKDAQDGRTHKEAKVGRLR